MEKLELKQEFTIYGIPVFVATENSFRGVFLAGQLLGILSFHFGEEFSNVPSGEDSKDSSDE